jgi:hypothetical protein
MDSAPDNAKGAHLGNLTDQDIGPRERHGYKPPRLIGRHAGRDKRKCNLQKRTHCLSGFAYSLKIAGKGLGSLNCDGHLKIPNRVALQRTICTVTCLFDAV